MLECIKQPWHWAIAGILIGLTVPALLILGNKKFGISSALRDICAVCLPNNIPFFTYNWKSKIWNLFFVVGIALGGFIAAHFLHNPATIIVAESTKASLTSWGISDYSQILPVEIFTFENIFTVKGLFFFVFGGFCVGFGTRYAGGCTSGHSIFGISNLQLPSLIATCCFMAGGFFSTNVLMPFVLQYL